MYLVLKLVLVAAVLWIFGTLPWVVVNAYFCSLPSSIACPDPVPVQDYIRQVLALDLILIILAAFAVAQLRRHPRPRSKTDRPQRRRQRG
ncbi:MAG: hypothetical protein ACFB4J_18230 [Elainellaceae cyanobacterium]